MSESVTAAARRDVLETNSLKHLARLIATRQKWLGSSEKAAQVRVSQMLAGTRPLPADVIPDVIEATGRTSVLGPISAAVIAAQAADLERDAGRTPSRTRVLSVRAVESQRDREAG